MRAVSEGGGLGGSKEAALEGSEEAEWHLRDHCEDERGLDSFLFGLKEVEDGGFYTFKRLLSQPYSHDVSSISGQQGAHPGRQLVSQQCHTAGTLENGPL